MTIPQTLCELCGKPAPDYVVRTGVSAYLACKSCWTDWVNHARIYLLCRSSPKREDENGHRHER